METRRYLTDKGRSWEIVREMTNLGGRADDEVVEGEEEVRQ